MSTSKSKQEFLLRTYSMDMSPNKQHIMKDNTYIAYINSIRNMEGLIKSLRDELGDTATVEVLWLRKKEKWVDANAWTTVIEVFEKEPPASRTCPHVVLVTSEDKKVIEYSQFLVNRYMNLYTSVIPAKDRRRSRVRENKVVKQSDGSNKIVGVKPRVVKKSATKPEKVSTPQSFCEKVVVKFLQKLINWLS